MTTFEDLKALAHLSVSDPEAGARALIASNVPMAVRWLALVAVIVLGVLVAYLLPLAQGAIELVPSPVSAAILQIGMNLGAIILVTAIGRAFGGQGQFEDAVLVIAWLQALMLVLQPIQLLTFLLLPALSVPVVLLSVGLFFWLFTGFICALHGFQSRLAVLAGTFGVIFSIATLISIFFIG